MGVRSTGAPAGAPAGNGCLHRMSAAIGQVLPGLLVSIGVALALWPVAARAINADVLASQARLVREQLGPIVRESPADGPLQQARAMNERLAERPAPRFGEGAAPEGYASWRPVDDDIVASVEIPSIGLALPVRLGTSDEALAGGAGHLAGSSLPVGGASTHCVLCAHTAYRDARLFDDIGSLAAGADVILRSCAGALRYRVVGASVVDPAEPAPLAIQPGRDLLTLLTCYPPRVNTQRLLVLCERAEEPVAEPGTLGTEEARSQGDAMGSEGVIQERGHVPGWLVAALCALASVASGTLVGLAPRLAHVRSLRRHAMRAQTTRR